MRPLGSYRNPNQLAPSPPDSASVLSFLIINYLSLITVLSRKRHYTGPVAPEVRPQQSSLQSRQHQRAVFKQASRPSADKDNVLILEDSPPHVPFRDMGFHLNGLKEQIAQVIQRDREKLGKVIGGEPRPSWKPVTIDVPRPGRQAYVEDAGLQLSNCAHVIFHTY
jgi:hypothetical protein